MIERTENHEYKDGDIIYPGVTTVLQDVGIIPDYRFATPRRGKRMHTIVQYFLTGRLNFSNITREEQELIEWVVDLITKRKWELVGVEHILQNYLYHYAGTCDYIIFENDEKYIVDLKTGIQKESWHKIQIAAYQACIHHDTINVNGLLLYQRTKEVELITGQELQQKYFPVFKSALDVYNFKHGGIK